MQALMHLTDFFEMHNFDSVTFLVFLCSFFIVSFIRKWCFTKKKFLHICYYYIILTALMFVVTIAGGRVINAAYLRLETYQSLEKANELEDAQQHPKASDSMLQIDLQQFADSEEFIDDIKEHEFMQRCTEAIFVGLIVAMLAEFLQLCVVNVRYLVGSSIQIKNFSRVQLALYIILGFILSLKFISIGGDFFSIHNIHPCFIVLSSFFILCFIRQIFFPRKFLLVFFYYVVLIFIMFTLVIGGGGVTNDAYKRLEIYKSLEKDNKLEDAKQHPQAYDHMFQIDLYQFADSKQFEDYIKENYEYSLGADGYIAIGVIIAILAELSQLCVIGLCFLLKRRKYVTPNAISYAYD